MKTFDYLVADQLDAALAELDAAKDPKSPVHLKAGGIDLLDRYKERLESPAAVLSIERVEALRGIKEDADGLHVGALTTLADIARSDLVRAKYAALHTAAAHAATPQVREKATVGGNLAQRPRCWYFRNQEFHCLKKGGATCFAVEGENQYHAIMGGGPCHIVHPSNLAPALVALDALVVTKDAAGKEDRTKAADFFVLPKQNLYAETVLRPAQAITEVLIPKAPRQSATVEFREKQSFDWPILIASVARLDAGWRVALGAVAPVPWFSEPATKLLGAADITADLAARAGEAAASEATPMKDNAYKVQLTQVAVKRALLKAAGLEVPA